MNIIDQVGFHSFKIEGTPEVGAEIARVHEWVRREQQTSGENVFPDGGAAGGRSDLSQAQEAYVETGGDLIYATLGMRIVGFAGVKRPGILEMDAQLCRMATAPDLARNGIGKKVLELSLARAAQLGIRSIGLLTGSEEKAADMYERAGFRRTGTVIPKVRGFKDIEMRLDDLSAYAGKSPFSVPEATLLP